MRSIRGTRRARKIASASLRDSLAPPPDHIFTAAAELLGKAQQALTVWCGKRIRIHMIFNLLHPSLEVLITFVQFVVSKRKTSNPTNQDMSPSPK